jgi:hypothetical protein
MKSGIEKERLDQRALARYMKMNPHSDETMLLQKAMDIEARVDTGQPTERWVIEATFKVLERLLG